MTGNIASPPSGDITTETLVRLVDSPAKIPTRPSLRTVWRWAMKGCKGRRLETILVGGVRYCSEEAIQRFLASGISPSEATSRSSRKRQAAIDRAEQELDETGV